MSSFVNQHSTTNHTCGLREIQKPNLILYILPEQTGSWSSKIRQTSHEGKESSLQDTQSLWHQQTPLYGTVSFSRHPNPVSSPPSKTKPLTVLCIAAQGFCKQPHHKTTEPPRTSAGHKRSATSSTSHVVSNTGLLPTPPRSCQHTNHDICTSASDILTVSSSIC